MDSYRLLPMPGHFVKTIGQDICIRIGRIKLFVHRNLPRSQQACQEQAIHRCLAHGTADTAAPYVRRQASQSVDLMCTYAVPRCSSSLREQSRKTLKKHGVWR